MIPRIRRLVPVGSLLIVAAVLLMAPGCGQRPFSIAETRVCKTVDPAGIPGPETTLFTQEDPTAHIWFRYAGARAGQVVKVKLTHTDVAGNKTTIEAQHELKPGDGSAMAQLTPAEGEEGLTPGAYEAQITNASDVGYGPPLKFEVQ